MSGILNHSWGVSPAQDRVWAQVSGIAPSKAGKRLFLVLQAFIDDSYTDGGVFVLAGYIASAEAWAEFSNEWEEMLPYGTRKKCGLYHFRMSEMAQNEERMARVPAFYRIIEDHVLAGLTAKIEIPALRRAYARIKVPGLRMDWENLLTPYLVAFRVLIDMFHSYRTTLKELIPLDQKVDFYFDEQSEKKSILAAWDEYMGKRRKEMLKYYGATPRFESDDDFLPLQSADLLAWWVRRWYEAGKDPEGKIFDWDLKKKLPYIHFTYSEDQLIESLTSILALELEDHPEIYVLPGGDC